jgi:UDP-N-acetylmuramate--alanine ligase
VFVDEIGAMAQAVLDNARAGDVVVCMGAGSIGAVPGRVVELGGATPPPASGQFTREGRVL